MPMHADIVVRVRNIGFDNLTPILWHKITNASYEVENGSGFLGKPYEPNAIVKNDVEFILMLRNPGGYRQPTDEQREASRLTKQEHQEWFRQIWNGLRGESTRHHPAPFPEELAHRLVRMFSFAGDTVLDPFMGTGTTLLASAHCGRNAIGVEIEPAYVTMSKERIERDLGAIFRPATPARGMPGFPIRDDNAAAIGMASLTASAGRVSRSGGPAILTIPGSAGRLTLSPAVVGVGDKGRMARFR
jgi:site-specific DNA-methyltransferase (adenine-specific)